MQIYTQNKVRPVLMVHINSYLWNIPVPAWSDENKKDFEILKISNPGDIEIIIPKVYYRPIKGATTPKKVRRILDGTIYKSFRECELKNGLSRGILWRMLNGHSKKTTEEYEEVN